MLEKHKEDFASFKEERTNNYRKLKLAFESFRRGKEHFSFAHILDSFIINRYRNRSAPLIAREQTIVAPQASNIKNSWDEPDMSDQIHNYIQPTIAYKGDKHFYMTKSTTNHKIPNYASTKTNTGKFRNPMRKYFKKINHDPFDLNRFI